MRKILRYLNASDYIAGTLAISAMGVCRDFAAQLAQSLCDWLVRRLWVTVRLHEKDADLLLAWLRERPEIHGTSELWLYAKRGEGKSTRYEYEPEICYTTRVRCQGKAGGQWLWVTREARENGEAKAKVSFLGHDKGLLEGILQEGKEIQRRKREKFLTVVQVYDYGKDHGLNWLHPQDKDRKQPGRSICSVVLPLVPGTDKDQAQVLLDDAREFLNSESWYTERGYLLYGIPGGGNSA
ncbi:unnamed protein product [Effrenium voratum]|uniref:BCS1 N-terminal domain-containing protein n=1 Tax=Effrenium voratum TaxID=2562239 RepID=A0AA36J0K8_9DINO|nr:unnamed protein product [Effrenium voratum]